MSGCNVQGLPKELIESTAKKYAQLKDSEKEALHMSSDKTMSRVLNYAGYAPTDTAKILRVEGNNAVILDNNKIDKMPLTSLHDKDGNTLNPEDVKEFMSDIDFIAGNKKDYDTIVVDYVNDPEKMVELANEIAELDSKHIDLDYKNKLLNSVAKLADPLTRSLPDTVLYLNTQHTMTGGNIEVDLNNFKADLTMGIGPASGNRHSLEVFVHELYHGGTEFALASNDSGVLKIKHQLEDMFDNFIKNTEPEDLAKHFPDQSTALEDSKKLLDYIAKKGLSEFIPYSQTNIAMMKRIEELNTPRVRIKYGNRSLAQKVWDWFRVALAKFTDRLQKAPEGNDAARIAWLVTKLTVANNRQLSFKRNKKLDRISKVFDSVDNLITETIEGKTSKWKDEDTASISKNDKFLGLPLGRAVGVGKQVALSFVNQGAKNVLNTLLSLNLGLKPEGTIQSIKRDMSSQDAFMQYIDKFQMLKQYIDSIREAVHRTTVSSVEEAFGRKLTQQDNNVFKVLMETDAIVLGDDLEIYAKHKNILLTDITKLENKLKSKYGEAIANYYKGQSLWLSKYMLGGKPSIALLTNAKNIAQRINDVTIDLNIDQETIDDIDKLVSMYALRDSNAEHVKQLSQMFSTKDDQKGLTILIANLTALGKESEELFNKVEGEDKLRVKGYYKEIFKKNTQFKIATLDKESELKNQGFKLVKKVFSHSKHNAEADFGFFVSTLPVEPRLHTTAFRYTGQQHRGTTITESYVMEGTDGVSIKAETDIIKLRTEMIEVVQEFKKGNFDLKEENQHIRPIVNPKGEVIDFSYEMTKEDKIDLLGSSTDYLDLLGATRGNVEDKKRTPIHNSEVIKGLMAEAKNLSFFNKRTLLGSNKIEYVLLGPDSTNEHIQDMWKRLPDNIKDEIMKEAAKNKTPEGIYIRREAMLGIVGAMEKQVTSTKLINKLPEEYKYYMKLSGLIWKNVVGVAKGNIIIKMPFVLLGNVVSNVMTSIMLGANPVTVLKLQLEGVNELNKFLENSREVYKLEVKVKAGVATPTDIRELHSYKSKLNNSPVKDLIEKEGFYTQILEEFDPRVEQDTGNVVSDYIHNKVLSKAPTFIRNGASLLFLDNKTTYFKFMNRSTQYSDFAGRYAQYQLSIRKGVPHRKAVEFARSAFINYAAPNSPWLEWANQMGVVMFTKYFTRIQRFIWESAKEHPARIAVGLLTLGVIAPGVPTPWDSSPLDKNMFSLVQNPLDTVGNVLTPGILHAVSGS